MASTSSPDPEWVTVAEYAEFYRVAPRTVLRWIDSDPDMRVKRLGPGGRTIRIHRSELNSDAPAA